MDHFIIEYARMRQIEIDKELEAISAARLAGPSILQRRCGKALVETGTLLVKLGGRIMRIGQLMTIRPEIVNPMEWK